MNIDFSVNGFRKASKAFEEASNKFKSLKPRFIELSLEYIKERANEYIVATTGNSDWYTLTHTLENSWTVNLIEQSLMNYCQYSAFVEYGTGVIGAGTHPDSNGYQYDANGHGDVGWFFFDKEGILHWTQGMEVHAFLFNAVNDYLYRGGFDKIIKQTMDEVFGGLE